MTKHKGNAEWFAAAPLEFKEEGAPDPVKAIEELTATITAKFGELTTEQKALKDRLDAEIAKRNRPGTGQETKDEEAKLEGKAFTTFLRKGREALTADETKTMRVADDTSGGYLAPADFSTEVVKGIVQFSPVRQAASVGSTSLGSVILPKRTGRPTANWEGETEDSEETESEYGQLEIVVHEARCYVDVSNKLLEDAAVDVSAEVSGDLSEEFGRLEGAAFVTGDGNKKPMGFMQDASVSFSNNGHATVVQSDGVVGLMYALKSSYRNAGSWMMNGTTLGLVRKIKDGQGNYLWQPSFQAGQPETLLGRPVFEVPDMDDVANGTYPIAFGDFSRGYRIYDRISLSLLRDPYTQAKSGVTRFHARRRVGGGVRLPEAIRKLKMA